MKPFFVLCLLCLSQVSSANPKKSPALSLPLKAGARWILTTNLDLQKTGLTPEEFVPYVRVWSLKSNSFMKSGFSSTDSCEFRTAISKKITKRTSVQVKKSTLFSVANIQESTMSVIIDITNTPSKNSEVDQIQITCSAYEQGLDSAELKQKFKDDIRLSLASLFKAK